MVRQRQRQSEDDEDREWKGTLSLMIPLVSLALSMPQVLLLAAVLREAQLALVAPSAQRPVRRIHAW
jgi:hypothetical protein